MKKYLALFAIITAMLSSNAFAEIYKRVDADGRITYSNVKTKGATRLELDPDANTIANYPPRVNEKSSSNKRTATPEGFPKVDKQTQNQRDSKRQDILQSELESEKAALDQAKKAYSEGESNPEVFRAANGKTFRNVPKFDEKMKDLQSDIDSHQNNIQLLEKELDALH
jgi:hypothetical protein